MSRPKQRTLSSAGGAAPDPLLCADIRRRRSYEQRPGRMLCELPTALRELRCGFLDDTVPKILLAAVLRLG